VRRRVFIALAGSAALVRPSVAQQSTKRPVIGLLSSVSFESYAARVTAFRQGLNDVGFVEGTNVTVEYRSADGQVERLAMLAAELVRQQVDAIVTIGGEVPARAAKTATSTIPIVFAAGGDAVDVGLVTSLSRPEANSTGVSFFSSELGPKRLELLRELLPQANLFAYLTGPTSTTPTTERYTKALLKAVHNMGLQGIALSADTEQKIEEAFATMVERRVDGLVVDNDAFLNSRRDQIVTLATHHAVPAMFPIASTSSLAA
jgi:putative tryptophan/tyrosine transport system substrate-binding protein